MQKKLISVIVPVYNNEKYVNRCIDSILNQTYENLEVLLIDDGSTDGSIKICNNWAQKDKRIKVVSQKNSGTSNARNHGIKMATGDYVSFVDNDDWLRPEMYQTMLETMTKENAELVFCRFINVDEKYNRKYTNEINLSKENLKNPQYFFVKTKNKKGFCYNIACCNRILIKKDLLNDLEFCTELEHYENVLFVLNLINKTHKIAIANDHLYNHFNPVADTRVYDKTYFDALKKYYTELKTFFETNSKELSYLADHEYIMKTIKAVIKNKHFAKNMKTISNTDEVFKTHLNKAEYQKLKKAGYNSNLVLKLVYHKKWCLLKLFFKNI